MRFTSLLYEEAKKKDILIENIMFPENENMASGTIMSLLKNGDFITVQYKLYWDNTFRLMFNKGHHNDEAIIFANNTDIHSVAEVLSILTSAITSLNNEQQTGVIKLWEGIITEKGGSLEKLHFNTLPDNVADEDYVSLAMTPIELMIGVGLGYGVSLDFKIDLNTVLVEDSDVQFRAYGVDLAGQLKMIHSDEKIIKNNMASLENHLKECGTEMIKDVILPYYNDELMKINFKIHAV